ncbi:MAG: hypothetical protein GEV08_23355 [Acidimicrobiia bacterium]|nr:hypothetical protein [Acidimicrobiia bacterium]
MSPNQLPPEWAPPGWTPPPEGPAPFVVPPTPVVVPAAAPPAEGLDPDPFARLAARRTLFVHGPLDTAASNQLAAQLMALDAASPQPITLLVNSPGGPLEDLAPLLDVLSIVTAPVGATCLGQASGTAAVLVACATGRRRAAPAARLGLRLGPVAAPATLTGTAEELELLARDHQARLDDLARLLSQVSRLDIERARKELESGPLHDAAAAVEAGLVDEVHERRR